MELIQSFIAIWEGAVEQQVLPENTSPVAAHQPTQSPESVAIEALLFNKPPSTMQTTPQNAVADVKTV